MENRKNSVLPLFIIDRFAGKKKEKKIRGIKSLSKEIKFKEKT